MALCPKPSHGAHRQRPLGDAELGDAKRGHQRDWGERRMATGKGPRRVVGFSWLLKTGRSYERFQQVHLSCIQGI